MSYSTNKIGALIIDIVGHELSQEDREILAHPLVGGVILFARNYDSRKQLKQLCQQIHELRDTPLLIMVDQEGGRVQRFINEFTSLPAFSTFGKRYENDPYVACDSARYYGHLMASELLSTGINFSLSPVLDLNKGMSTIIGERAFHRDPIIVIQLAKAFIQGMQSAGMAATGKHFPGHGSVTLDSHVAVPVDERSLSEIEQEDMLPFIQLFNKGISAIMAAHIIFPKVDKLPVGFSHAWLHDILRVRLGFAGTIFSDDLHMEGANISANYADRMMCAREAGCDFVLLCNHRPGVIQVLDQVSSMPHQVTQDKWHALKGEYRGDRE